MRSAARPPASSPCARAALSPARLAALACLAALTSGCRAHRTLEIATDPPGALVYLDQEVLGPSPVEVEFWHYGVRRITATLPGYRTLSEVVEIVPPWYARFPIDIASEVLFPIGWRDHHEVHLVLESGLEAITTPDIRSVLDRAEVLRRAGPEGPRALPPHRLTSHGKEPPADAEEP